MKRVSTPKLLVVLVVLSALAWALLQFPIALPPAVVTNFDDCVKAGFPVMESYPPQCKTPDGSIFVQDVPQLPSNDVTSNDATSSNATTTDSQCIVSGCSGELCISSDDQEHGMSNCIFRPEFACYKQATCEIQPNGQCGWTQTPEFFKCVQDTKSSIPKPVELPM